MASFLRRNRGERTGVYAVLREPHHALKKQRLQEKAQYATGSTPFRACLHSLFLTRRIASMRTIQCNRSIT